MLFDKIRSIFKLLFFVNLFSIFFNLQNKSILRNSVSVEVLPKSGEQQSNLMTRIRHRLGLFVVAVIVMVTTPGVVGLLSTNT